MESQSLCCIPFSESNNTYKAPSYAKYTITLCTMTGITWGSEINHISMYNIGKCACEQRRKEYITMAAFPIHYPKTSIKISGEKGFGEFLEFLTPSDLIQLGTG